MGQSVNYQKELDGIIESIREAGTAPRLLLHSCCAPCSSYVLEYLTEHFSVTVYFYNPNITDGAEYRKRTEEMVRLIGEQPHTLPVTFEEGPWDPEHFYEIAKGLETCREGGERCFRCYELRLRESARRAAEGDTDPETGEKRPYDYFTTSLTISPLKNAKKLNELGMMIGEEYGVRWLPSDFKKKGGYQRSIELSKEYDLYRQNYCGCIFSKRIREEQDRISGNGTSQSPAEMCR